MRTAACSCVLSLAASFAMPVTAEDIFDEVEHRYAVNGDVRIHYAVTGPKDAPLVVFLHGFPDFWYSWREQMAALRDRFQVAALDLRGYNRSDKPKGVANYAMPHFGCGRGRRHRRRKARAGGGGGPRLGRRGGVERGHDATGAGAPAGDSEPAASARPLPRTHHQRRATPQQPVRLQLPAAGRAQDAHRPRAGVLGARSRGQETLCRGFRAVGLRGHAELLQGELPAAARTRRRGRRANHGGHRSRRPRHAQRALSGVDVPRFGRHRVAAGRARRNVELGGRRPHGW